MSAEGLKPTHRYVGRARPEWHGRGCRVTIGLKGRRRGSIRNVEITFTDDGTKTITHIRCLRRIKPKPPKGLFDYEAPPG